MTLRRMSRRSKVKHSKRTSLMKKQRRLHKRSLRRKVYTRKSTRYNKFGSMTSDDTIISEKLKEKNLKKIDIKGDGNCLYRSLAKMIYRDENQWKIVKTELLEWACKNKEIVLRDFIGIDENEFNKEISVLENDEEWGGLTSIRIAERKYNVCIRIISTIEAYEYFDANRDCNDIPTYYLVYTGDNHYDATEKDEPDLTKTKGSDQNKKTDGLPNATVSLTSEPDENIFTQIIKLCNDIKKLKEIAKVVPNRVL